MELTVGHITFTIPDDCIFYDDFAEVALREAPNAFEFDSDGNVRLNTENKDNWNRKKLRNIGFKLKDYPRVEKIAREAGCNATSALAVALANFYLFGRTTVRDSEYEIQEFTKGVLKIVAEKYAKLT